MNILMFTRCIGLGGTEKVIFQLSELLENNGHTPIICAAVGQGIGYIKKKHIKFYEIPDMQSKSPKTFLEIVITIEKIIKTEHIDIVHTHHRMAAFYIRLLLPFVKVRFVNNIHNTFDDKKVLTKFAFEKAVNIAVGETVRNNMVHDYDISKNNIKVIYNAIDNKKTISNPIEVIDQLKKDGFFVVGNIGRINTQKGFEYYIKAAKKIKEQGLKIKFLIIGDGVLADKIKQMIKKLNLENTVVFYGFANDVLNVIRNLDLVVLSSLWEGFPLTPIETFSMGKTIVDTDVPGTMEIVKDNINGLIVSREDSVAIAKAVEILYKDSAKKYELEQNAKKTYDEKFSYVSFCKKYINIYDLCMADKKEIF